MDRPSILKATLIGGVVFGVLGSIPLLDLINCFCCALIIAGGFVAAYLHASDCKKVGLEFGAGNGALVGLVAGLFYAIANAIVQGLFAIVVGRPDLGEVLEKMEEAGAPPEVIEAIEPVIEMLAAPAGVLVTFGVTLLLALVFSTIGGLIGGAVFKVEAAPPAAPSPSVPPPPPISTDGGGSPPGGST